jgi:hypothetical protein
MNVQELLDWVLLLIFVATLVSGAVQIFVPGFIPGLIAGKITPATQHMKLAGNQKSLP